MRFKIARPNEVTLVAEVGDQVSLVDYATHEHLVDPVRLREVPCRIEWNIERQGRVGWALLDDSGCIQWIGDVQQVWPGCIYSLEVPT